MLASVPSREVMLPVSAMYNSRYWSHKGQGQPLHTMFNYIQKVHGTTNANFRAGQMVTKLTATICKVSETMQV